MPKLNNQDVKDILRREVGLQEPEGLSDDLKPKINNEEEVPTSDYKEPGLLPKYPDNPGKVSVWCPKKEINPMAYAKLTRDGYTERKDVQGDMGEVVLMEIDKSKRDAQDKYYDKKRINQFLQIMPNNARQEVQEKINMKMEGVKVSLVEGSGISQEVFPVSSIPVVDSSSGIERAVHFAFKNNPLGKQK